MHHENEMLIIEMADMLVGGEVESALVTRALSMICEAFPFGSGLVYESNEYGGFYLRERHAEDRTQLRDYCSLEEIECFRKHEDTSPAPYYLLCESAVGELEQKMLHFFYAKHMLIIPLAQESGVLVFASAQNSGCMAEQETRLLLALAHMLARYIGGRSVQNKIIAAHKMLEGILEHCGIDVYVNDFHTHEVLYVNSSMAEPYGGVAEFRKNKCYETLYPGQGAPCTFCPQIKLVDEEGNPTKLYSWDYQRARDGAWFRVFSAAFLWTDGRLAHVVSSADITDNKKNEALIEYMAHYDSLTGLPNRRMLIADCDRRIHAVGEGTRGYMLFFDIDGFKAINDTLGHDAGDEFLIQLGTFFSEMQWLSGATYRNGGDEFVSIIDGEITESGLQRLIADIHTRFRAPWQLKKGAVFCSMSIGVSCYPEDGATAEALIAKADQAMYIGKKAGGACTVFGRDVEPAEQ